MPQATSTHSLSTALPYGLHIAHMYLVCLRATPCAQVSRLQTGLELCREVYEQIKGELKNPLEEYSLFWPEQKVGSLTSWPANPALASVSRCLGREKEHLVRG